MLSVSQPATHRFASLFQFADRAVTPVAQIVTRLVFGQAFALAGWGKLQDLPKVTSFFESLGIPFANVQAPMVATFEFVGGLCLLLGLGTRFAAAILTCTMIVALVTADLESIGKGFRLEAGFDAAAPVPYLVATLWLLAKGAGALSVDALIARKQSRS